jgi:DNA repair photolyase
LESKKLDALENSYDSFEYQLNNSKEPIAVSCGSKPYKIINGRHRVLKNGIKLCHNSLANINAQTNPYFSKVKLLE